MTYLEYVKSYKLTQEQAAAKYGVGWRMICYKLNRKYKLKPGKSNRCEEDLCDMTIIFLGLLVK